VQEQLQVTKVNLFVGCTESLAMKEIQPQVSSFWLLFLALFLKFKVWFKECERQ
jgi:hypothetical protein